MDAIFDILDPSILQDYPDFLMADPPSSSSPLAAAPHLGSIYDATPLARIEVGQPGDTDLSNAVFYVEAAVWTLSPYLKAAFEGNFIEAANRTISLPEDDPEQVGLYLHWLGSGFDDSPNPYCREEHLSKGTRTDWLRLPIPWVFNGSLETYKATLLDSDLEYAETYAFARRIGDTDYAQDVAERFLNVVSAHSSSPVTWLSPAAANELWDQTPGYQLSGLRRALADVCMTHYVKLLSWIDDGTIAINLQNARPSAKTSRLEQASAHAHTARGRTELMNSILSLNGYCKDFCDDLLACCISGYYPEQEPVSDEDAEVQVPSRMSAGRKRLEILRGERTW